MHQEPTLFIKIVLAISFLVGIPLLIILPDMIDHKAPRLGAVLDCNGGGTRITYDTPNSERLGVGFYTTNRNGDWFVTTQPTSTPFTELVFNKDFNAKIGTNFTYVEPVLTEYVNCSDGKQYPVTRQEMDSYIYQNMKPTKTDTDPQIIKI